MADDRGGDVVARRVQLAPAPESARSARHAVSDTLLDVGRADLLDTAALLASELVTNAVVHARTPIDVQIWAATSGLRVAVTDRSPALPMQRHYGQVATTGRGLELLELLSDRYGTEAGADGKTVWFELGSVGFPAATPTVPGARAEPHPVTPLRVSLLHLPVVLALAWQQHADTLLREYLLARWDEDHRLPPAPIDDGAAHDAFARLAANFESLTAIADDPEARDDVDLTLDLDLEQVGQFIELDLLLDHVLGWAEQGLTLAPTTQPEVREFRRWLLAEIADQAEGAEPRPWPGLPSDLLPAEVAPVVWDPAEVTSATVPMIAADDLNRILAANQAALELLGWDDELVGRRLVSIIPRRFRERHIASFTLNLLGEPGTIIDREITLPALRRDGTELMVRLRVRQDKVPPGRTVFLATLHRA